MATEIDWKGRLIARGPLIQRKVVPVIVANHEHEISNREDCTCELCRNAGIQRRNSLGQSAEDTEAAPHILQDTEYP